MPPKRQAGRRARSPLLEEWVRRGAAFPRRDRRRAGKGIDLAEGRKFWSFQPPRAGRRRPAVKDAAGRAGRIDAFLLAEMEKRRPGAVAAGRSRRTLIRRVDFDLIGLPPTPEEVEAFVKDDRRPDAYERLVDRLLASPHYGERWGRFWLDLARYCDIAEPWAETKGQP